MKKRNRHISEDLVEEGILPLVPAKTLARFKSVCKRWYSVISSHRFVKLHLHRQSSLSRFSFFLKLGDAKPIQYGLWLQPSETKSSSLDDFVMKFDHKLVKDPQKTRHSKLVGSSGGLVCLLCFDGKKSGRSKRYDGGTSDRPKRYFALCNPTTGHCRVIDFPTQNPSSMLGFGYVKALDDYKICCNDTTSNRHFYMYSTRTGIWKCVTISEYGDVDNGDETWFRQGTYLNDTVYWIRKTVSSHHYDLTNVDIVGFNLYSEQFNKPLPFPTQCPTKYYDSLILMEVKGCLGVFWRNRLPSKKTQIWILKQQPKDLWEPFITFPSLSPNMEFLCSSEADLCLTKSLGNLYLIDPAHYIGVVEDMIVGEMKFDGKAPPIYAVSYVDSLVSPFGVPKSDKEENN